MYDKIVLTDFCHTIVNYPTCDNFVRYVKRKVGVNTWSMAFNEGLRIILQKTRLIRLLDHIYPKVMTNKVLFLRQLKGIKEDVIKQLGREYYDAYMKPNLIQEVVQYLKELNADGYKIFVISSAYDTYLRYLVDDLPIEGILCTEMKYKDGKFTGRYKDMDCFGNEKYLRAKKFFKTESLKDIDSIGLSDELADYPMLDMCRKSIIVKEAGSEPQKWIKEKGYEMLEFWPDGGVRLWINSFFTNIFQTIQNLNHLFCFPKEQLYCFSNGSLVGGDE